MFCGVYNSPLFAQLPVLLFICSIEPEQRLQMAPVRFHILVINVDVVEVLLLLKNLLCCALIQGERKHTYGEMDT